MSKELDKIPFKTLLNLPKAVGMPTGTEYENQYGYDMDHKYIVGLSKTGEINRYEMIQMHKDDCDIGLALARAQRDPLTGEPILPKRSDGQYMDMTEMPTTMSEFQNVRISCIRQWEKLTPDQKKAFDNSVEAYITEYGTEKWFNTVAPKKETPIETPVETPVETPKEGGNE